MRSVSAFLSNRILQRGFVTQTTSASASAAAATTTTARTSLYQSTSPHPKILSLQLQQQQQQQQPRLCNKSFTNSRRLLSTSKSNNNRPKIKPDTHLKPSSSSVYGLRRIDYSLVVPPRWPMPPHPPPQKGLRRFVFACHSTTLPRQRQGKNLDE